MGDREVGKPDAPLVCNNAVPTLMPMPNSTMVPQVSGLGVLPGHDADARQEHQRHGRKRGR